MSLMVLSMLWSASALASGDAEEAEVTFQLGARAYGSSDYSQALAYFLASNRLAPNAAVAFNIARCYARTEQYAEAYRWFTLAQAGLTAPNVQRAVADELSSITPKVVVFDVQSDPPGATVYSERKDLGAIGVTPLKIALEPSADARTFIFEKDGYQETTLEKVTGSRGQVIPIAATLKQVVGIVDIHTPDGTTVHQGAPDGPVVCEAPCEAKLAPGNWVLYFRKEGFRDAVRQLEVTADQTITTLVDLSPNTGSVVVDASERGALIEVDGKAVGFTPTVVNAVAVGERLVRVSRPGYQAVERRVLVETDKQVALDDVELLPMDEVTAVSRRAERIELAPSSVTIISHEELTAFQYPTIYEALRGVRGFALGYDSIYGNAAVRGLGAPNDYNSRLLILQDGATLNDNILSQGFISYDGRVDLGGVERIEVVRGPGSVLYGTGAVSGVVNLVTDGRDSPQSTEFSVGTYDNHVLRAGAQAHYNLNDAIGFRAALSGAASQGRLESIDPKGDLTPPVPVDAFDGFEAATTTGRVWVGDATLQWFHTTRDITIPTGVYATNLNDPTHVWTDTRSMGELRYEPQLTESIRLLTRAYFNRYKYNGNLPYGRTDSIETYLGVGGGAEARVVAEAGETFRLTAGGLVEDSPQVTLEGGDFRQDGSRIDTYLKTEFPYQVVAGYALVDLAPVEQVRLTVGGRVDYWSASKTTAFSPRLALVLVPDDGDFIKLMGGRAFRAPTIYELSYSAPGQEVPEALDPETVWSGELEYTHAFDASWSGLVSGYGSLAQGIVETIPAPDAGIDPFLPSAVTYANSQDPIRILGFDLELRRAFQGGWMLSGFYGALDSRYTSGPYADELVPNVPQNNAGVKLIVPISAPVARIAFRTALEAPRRTSLADYQTSPLAAVADVVLSGTVPERGFDYAVGVYNLFNMQYGEPAGDTFALRTMPQQGRSLMASFSLRL